MGIDVGQNIQMRPDYQSVIVNMIPDRCERALDVGCGHGALTSRLRTLASAVEGIDKDRRSIDKALAHPDAGDIAYHYGDFLTWPFAPESFDLITAAPAVYSAPVCWPPPATYRDMQHLAQQLLPKARYRRHLYWRYSLTWSQPR